MAEIIQETPASLSSFRTELLRNFSGNLEIKKLVIDAEATLNQSNLPLAAKEKINNLFVELKR